MFLVQKPEVAKQDDNSKKTALITQMNNEFAGSLDSNITKCQRW